MRDGAPERIRDPFTQALDHRYALTRRIDAVKGWHGRDMLIVHALALPDVTVHQLVLAPDAPREILLDRGDVRGDLSGALERVLAFHRGARERRGAPGADGAAMLRELLAPSFSLRVPMAEEFLDEEEVLIRLTSEQSLALARLARNRRLVVYGCAGSGKTMLAVEHAKRLARSGLRVLFVCFNRALAQHLRNAERDKRVDFFSFHGLCTHLAGQARIKLPQYARGSAPAGYFDDVLPDALVEAIGRIGEQYDALVVDEAQDLRESWFTALQCTLREEHRAAIWLFVDDNQRIFHDASAIPDDYMSFELTVNCRNTQSIHREVMKLYRGAVVPDVRGPLGRAVELHHAEDPVKVVAGVIERLCGEEEIPPQDIVVLSAHGWENSRVAHAPTRGRHTLTKERGKLGRYVHFSSIRAFKGLESPVVILCELEDLDDDTADQQLYVGLSRARNHCVIVAPPTASDSDLAERP